jgi:nitrogen-specific signal transduction histidine kinase
MAANEGPKAVGATYLAELIKAQTETINKLMDTLTLFVDQQTKHNGSENLREKIE